MAATPNDPQSLAADLLAALDDGAGAGLDEPGRGGGWRKWGLLVLVLLIVVGLATAAVAALSVRMREKAADTALTYTVSRGELIVTVTEEGALESADNVELKCQVAGGSTILWLIEDGSMVEKGTLLAKLDSSQLEDQISQQRITFEKARASYVQAEKDFNVAKIAVREYLEGTYQQDLQTLEANITIALENQRNAENTLLYTQRMFRKGYATALQREAQEFAVKRAKLELESAETAKHVLNEFTKAKMMEDLNSQLATAEAKMKSEKAAFELEEGRLKRLEGHLEKCEITAPKAGMVVYANDMSFGPRRGSQPTIEEGAMVREQQGIFRLPDLTKMQVKVAVHESKVEQLKRGMRARIRVGDRQFQGEVVSVAGQPEPTHFFSSNVKEYATIVSIEGEAEGLKPGLTAEVEILVAHLKDTLSLPVAAVVEQKDRFCAWVKKGNDTEKRELKLGLSSKDYVQVLDGVAVGEEVILNPRAIVAEARESDVETEAVDVGKKFGESARQPAARPDGPPRESGPPPPPGADGSAAPPPAGFQPPSGAGGGGPPGGGFNPMDNDLNGDGKLSREETPGWMADRFDQIDTNRDGFLDQAELGAMRRRFSERGGFSGRGGSGGGGPPGGSPP